MAPQSITAAIFASSQPHIVKKTNVSRLIFSIIYLVVGVILIMIYLFGIESSFIMMRIGLVGLGLGLISYGIYRLFNNHEMSVYLPTGSITKELSCYYDLKHLDSLKQFIDTGDFSLLSGVEPGLSGNLRVDLIISKDKSFAAIQLFQFVPYEYHPLTTIHYYTDGEARSINSYLEKNNLNF